MRLVQKGSFKAKSDDGSEVEIIIYRTEIASRSADVSDEAPHHGMINLKTRDGSPVNRIIKGTYQVVDTGLVVRSSSPMAP